MSECVICAAGRPRDTALELDALWVTIPPSTPLPGYVCLVSKRHVREPFEMSEDDRRAWWDAVDGVAEALNNALRPAKLNYEIHGNTIPHLHLHLFPRRTGDRFAGRPIDWRDAEPRPEGERRAILEGLRGLGDVV